MNMRKILAAMLVLVMVLAMVPAKAQAAEGDVPTYESGKLGIMMAVSAMLDK